MKNTLKRIVSFIMAVLLLVSCPLSVYASADHPWEGGLGLQLYYNLDEIKQYIKETAGFWIYYGHQVGAALTADFKKFVENSDKFDELLADEKVGLYKDDNGNIKGVYTSKEFMAQLKALIDEYAKTENLKEENGGFYLLPTTDFSTVPSNYFINANQYRTFRNIVLEKGCLAVMTKYYSRPMRFVDPFSDPDHPILLVGLLGDLNRLENYPYMPVESKYFCADEWQYHKYRVQTFPDENTIYTSCSDGIDFETASKPDLYNNYVHINWDPENHGGYSSDAWILYSTTGERIRVFVSENAAKNYTIGNRKVYFTDNYYNYVPEDLSVSIDDLQKTVDDLQKVIDELLKQIGNDTSEKEIEELLKKILEELQNQGGSGGEGPGGGDVNVDIDLSGTNTLLSKILAKVTQIFDKLQSSGSEGTGGNILQESLDALLTKLDDLNIMLKKYLSEITGDLDDIKGQLASMSEQEFEQKSDSFLGEVMDAFSEILEVVKTKFPFSIPNDLRIFLSKIAPVQPEAEAALYLNDMSGIALYSGEHGGSGTTDGETNPPGGGGASRPGSSFVDVEHGGGGGSREPAEMREAPVFRLPIVIERYGIEEYIVIDMAPFDPLSRFSRSFFTIIFMVCLFNLTFKVIGMWGDIVG